VQPTKSLSMTLGTRLELTKIMIMTIAVSACQTEHYYAQRAGITKSIDLVSIFLSPPSIRSRYIKQSNLMHLQMSKLHKNNYFSKTIQGLQLKISFHNIIYSFFLNSWSSSHYIFHKNLHPSLSGITAAMSDDYDPNNNFPAVCIFCVYVCFILITFCDTVY
jgi:hypothetical protein